MPCFKPQTILTRGRMLSCKYIPHIPVVQCIRASFWTRLACMDFQVGVFRGLFHSTTASTDVSLHNGFGFNMVTVLSGCVFVWGFVFGFLVALYLRHLEAKILRFTWYQYLRDLELTPAKLRQVFTMLFSCCVVPPIKHTTQTSNHRNDSQNEKKLYTFFEFCWIL